MKKSFIILGILGLGILMQFKSLGHAWTHYQSWCWDGHKYNAYAETSALSLWYFINNTDCWGRRLDGPIVAAMSVCWQESHGCSRPRIASCDPGIYWYWVYDEIWNYCAPQSLTGGGWYYAKAIANYAISGPIITQVVGGRGSAGYVDTSGDIVVDSAIFANLNTQGTSQDSVSGSDTVDEKNNLVVSGLSGFVSITNNTDYYADLQVIAVIHDTTDTTDTAELAARNGTFLNSVYSAEIYVSKGNITTTGFFSSMNPNQLTQIDPQTGNFGVNLNNISATIPLNVQLKPSQYLGVYTVVDGALDISSAIIKGANRSSNNNVNHYKTLQESVEIYPNPANSTINCNLVVATDNSNVSIKAIDVTGRSLGEIYSGTVNRGTNLIPNIDVSHLPAGVEIFEIKVGDKTTYKKITITR